MVTYHLPFSCFAAISVIILLGPRGVCSFSLADNAARPPLCVIRSASAASTDFVAFAGVFNPPSLSRSSRTSRSSILFGSTKNEGVFGDDEATAVPPSVGSATERLEECKRDLMSMCQDRSPGSGSSSSIESKARELEILGEDAGFGQASSLSGLLSGEWKLIYAPDDATRSSPFFWAFRRAFPDSSDQIFSITDAIPAPLKVIGPAIQTIDVDSNARPVVGSLVSQVEVSTLGGMASSIMTTRCAVLNAEGLDGLRMRVETTKPEKSTALQKLGPLGEFLNESAPPFPSGEALERVSPGSSEVVMRTTYCDESIRISRNDMRSNQEVFVWRRAGFGSGNSISV